MENNKQEEKKIKEVKEYTLRWTIYEDHSTCLRRKNDGFNIMELLGILSSTILDINEQIKNPIEPDIIERQVIR